MEYAQRVSEFPWFDRIQRIRKGAGTGGLSSPKSGNEALGPAADDLPTAVAISRQRPVERGDKCVDFWISVLFGI